MAKKVSVITMQNEQVKKVVNIPNAITRIVETVEYTTHAWNDKKMRSYIVDNDSALSAQCLSGRSLWDKTSKTYDPNTRLRIEITSTDETPSNSQPIKYWHICECGNIFPIFKPSDTKLHSILCAYCGIECVQVQEVKA